MSFLSRDIQQKQSRNRVEKSDATERASSKSSRHGSLVTTCSEVVVKLNMHAFDKQRNGPRADEVVSLVNNVAGCHILSYVLLCQNLFDALGVACSFSFCVRIAQVADGSTKLDIINALSCSQRYRTQRVR